MNSSHDDKLISSIDLMDQTGMSRATLNNYIKMGILQKPIIKRPERPERSRTKRIGYFSQKETLERINAVKLLKKEGRTMEEISRSFIQKDSELIEAAQVISLDKKRIELDPHETACKDGDLTLSVGDIAYPSYLIDHQFRICWINKQAEEKIFRRPVSFLRNAESRNIFSLFNEMELSDGIYGNPSDVLSFHLRFLKERNGDEMPAQCFMGLPEAITATYKTMYDNIKPDSKESSLNSFVKLADLNGSFSSYQIHSMTFREGILFVYAPVEGMMKGVVELLSNRSRLINELLRNRMPTLVSFCVLVADLQNSVRICAELPSREYFELINQIWKNMEPIFKKYYGTYGKHTGDGMVYYFLKEQRSSYIMNAAKCALELRNAMKKLSKEWKIRKGWLHELYLNIGINQGQEYFGTIPAAPTIEFTVLGDSVNNACRLSDFSRNGAIWITKSLVNLMSDAEYEKLRYGVRKGAPGSEFVLEKTFTRVMDILTPDESGYRKYADIATLPVTELLEIMDDDVSLIHNEFF